MTLRFTILGCGSSGGVPRPGTGWGACDPANPKNRRRRCALLVERASAAGITRVLIDTGPDLREQLIDANVPWLDAVLYSHEHADHTHGLDDVRAISVRRDGPLPMYGSAETMTALARKFGYVFDDMARPRPGTSKPEGRARVLAENETVTIGDVDVTPVVVPHGRAKVFGYRTLKCLIKFASRLEPVGERTKCFVELRFMLIELGFDATLKFRRFLPHFGKNALEITLEFRPEA
jgi:phosphoribosyl 1,2-cyclic phosphate phosphodiesterase